MLKKPLNLAVVLLFFILLIVSASAVLGAQAKSGTNRPGASPKKPAAAASAGKKPTTTKRNGKPAPKRTVSRTAPAPVDQSRPTKDRYAEIQTALVKSGYYSGPTDGNWGDESVKALQQFQESQGLEPTGKIDSLTLIRLELGPHYENDGAAFQAPASKPTG